MHEPDTQRIALTYCAT